MECVISDEVSSIIDDNQKYQPFISNVIHKVNQETKRNRKKRLFLSVVVLLLSLLGGTLNIRTIQDTRLSLGPDIYQLYKEGGIFQLQEDFLNSGYEELYVDVNFESEHLELYAYSLELLNKKEEILQFVNQFLEKRDFS